MDSAAIPDSKWALTREALVKFLACLDADTDRAGEKYESVRLRLVKYFDWRGAHFPDECADETINRVIRRLDAGEVLRDIETYCLGVARLVFLETLKKPDRLHIDLDVAHGMVAPSSTASESEENSEQLNCFNRCLQELPPESRLLILQYYQDERREKINNRQAMADRLGIPLNALRSRARRVRDRLERCIDRCLEKITPGGEK